MTVLAAVDMREGTGCVLEEADRHARALGEDLIVCHAGATSDGRVAEIAARGHAHTGRGEHEFETVVMPGTAANEILRAARWRSVDIVVLGEPRHVGLARLFHRCTLRRVMRRVEVPVLVARESPRTSQIIVASDLLDARFPEIAITSREIALFGTDTRVTALHCVDTPTHESSIGEGEDWVDTLPPRYSAQVQWAREALDLALQVHCVDAEQQVVLGPIQKTILAAAAGFGAELIVIGNRHRGRIERVTEGTVSEHVAMYAPCSVMIVPVQTSAAMPTARASHHDFV